MFVLKTNPLLALHLDETFILSESGITGYMVSTRKPGKQANFISYKVHREHQKIFLQKPDKR